MGIKKVLCIIIISSTVFLNACKSELNKAEEDSASSEKTTTAPSITYMVESENDIFTSDLFANVCLIRKIPFLGQREITEYEEILEICQMFASLEFIAQREQSTDPFEMPLGLCTITLRYTDDTEYDICFGIELYYNHNIYTAKQGQFEELYERLREIFSE